MNDCLERREAFPDFFISIMNPESRTSKSLKNAKVALIFYCINLFLQFFSRKIFLDYLGSEILGLNTTAQNLLSFLNLAELGIGTAISYTLYKPLYEKNTETINEIVSIQGWMYRKIAYGVIIGACVLMCFFPWIFEKAQVSLWYAYGSFIVLLVGALLGYFANYRQIVLTADQKEYKITLNIQGFKILKVILQILAIRYLNNGYVYWMVLELLLAVITTIVLDKVIHREYPWLQSRPSLGGFYRKKYPEIITKTKQIFLHRIGVFTLGQSSSLIIYAYTSLTLVAIYGNYMLVVTGVTLLMNSLLNSISAGVGSLVAAGDRQRIKAVFWEITSCRIWLAGVMCYGIYKLSHSFIVLWVGEQYVLEQSALYALLVITFVGLTRTNDIFLAAYGLFQDVWAPLTEAALNIGCSIWLGYYYGLSGILWGVAISLLIVIVCWKPYFLYRCGFREPIGEYLLQQFKYCLVSGLSFLISDWLLHQMYSSPSVSGYYEWFKYALGVVSLYMAFSSVLFYFSDRGMRDLVKRVRMMITKTK